MNEVNVVSPAQSVSPVPSKDIMFLKEVMAVFKCGKTKLYDLINEGKAPKPSPNRHANKSVWVADQVHEAAEQYFKQFK